MNNNYGVITEQGYPVSDNFGFKPLTEDEKEKIEKSLEKMNNANKEPYNN